MSLNGNFQGMSPQDLLQWISSGHKSGVLSVSRGDEMRNIFFSKGDVVSVSSSRTKDRLGAMLIRKNLLRMDQLQDIRKVHELQSMQLGELLLKSNLVSRKQLQSTLQYQLEEIVFEILTWEEGNFTFEERTLNPSEMHVRPMKVSNLLLEGARRKDEWNRIRSVIPSNDVILRRNIDLSDIPPEIGESEKQLLQFLDIPRTVGDIFQLVNDSEFRILDTLRKFIEKGILVRDPALEEEKKKLSNKIDAILNRADELLKLQGYHEALAEYEKALKIDPENADVKRKKKLVIEKIIQEARKMISSDKLMPRVRQSFNQLSPENLVLSPEEGFVFSRIDGHTNIKTLKYVTNLSADRLYMVIHKLTRLGLVYLDKEALKMIKPRPRPRGF